MGVNLHFYLTLAFFPFPLLLSSLVLVHVRKGAASFVLPLFSDLSPPRPPPLPSTPLRSLPFPPPHFSFTSFLLLPSFHFLLLLPLFFIHIPTRKRKLLTFVLPFYRLFLFACTPFLFLKALQCIMKTARGVCVNKRPSSSNPSLISSLFLTPKIKANCSKKRHKRGMRFFFFL